MEYSSTSVNMCHRDWVNKEADWPIARQVEVRWDLQKKKERPKKERRNLSELGGDMER